MERKELLKKAIDLIEKEGKDCQEKVLTLLKKENIEANMHCGRPQEFFKELNNEIEWALGQFHALIVNEQPMSLSHMVSVSKGILKKKQEEK